MTRTAEGKARILADDTVIPLDNFTQRFIANIMRALLASLGHSGDKIYLMVENKKIDLFADGASVPFNSGLERELVESTVRGALSSLKGVVWFDKIVIISNG